VASHEKYLKRAVLSMGPVPTGYGDDDRCRDHDDVVFGDILVPAGSAESSNSETETDDYPGDNGYQLLPVTDSLQDSDENENTYEHAEIMPQPDVTMSTFIDNMLTANNPRHNSDVFAEDAEQLTQDRVEEIRFIMSSVTLPPSSIPMWATIVPENEWREKLLSLARQTESEVYNADVPLITATADGKEIPGLIH